MNHTPQPIGRRRRRFNAATVPSDAPRLFINLAAAQALIAEAVRDDRSLAQANAAAARMNAFEIWLSF